MKYLVPISSNPSFRYNAIDITLITLQCIALSVSSRIEKGHGATYHWGNLIMPAGHSADSVWFSNTHPPQLRVQTESVKYVDIASYYHYVHKPLSGVVS